MLFTDMATDVTQILGKAVYIIILTVRNIIKSLFTYFIISFLIFHESKCTHMQITQYMKHPLLSNIYRSKFKTCH